MRRILTVARGLLVVRALKCCRRYQEIRFTMDENTSLAGMTVPHLSAAVLHARSARPVKNPPCIPYPANKTLMFRSQ
jgi:hypothetical protein